MLGPTNVPDRLGNLGDLTMIYDQTDHRWRLAHMQTITVYPEGYEEENK